MSLVTFCSSQLTSFEFIFVNGSRVVSVIALEGGLPVIHVFPESTKLLEVDGPRSVSVKHTNHQPNSLRVERSPRALIGRGGGSKVSKLCDGYPRNYD